MVAVIRSFFLSIAELAPWRSYEKSQETPRIGAYPVDYSEPSEEDVAGANASCADVFKTGNWVSVNRKS